MAPELPELEPIVTYCREHLAQKHEPNPELEGYLAQLLVVRICAVVEQHIEACIGERAKASGDLRLASLVVELLDRQFRTPGWPEIKGQIKKLGPDLVDEIERTTTDTDRQALSSLVAHRHDVAHSRPPAITLRDALGWWDQARNVVLVSGQVIKSKV